MNVETEEEVESCKGLRARHENNIPKPCREAFVENWGVQRRCLEEFTEETVWIADQYGIEVPEGWHAVKNNCWEVENGGVVGGSGFHHIPCIMFTKEINEDYTILHEVVHALNPDFNEKETSERASDIKEKRKGENLITKIT